MISQTLEYALRAIVTIAQHGHAPCTARTISEISRVPWPYLSKLMQGLVRADVVSSKRGLHGGFVLTKPASELTIWEVVDAVEPIKRIHRCPLGIESHHAELCPLHRHLDDAMAMLEKSFRSTTVAQLVKQPTGSIPFCDNSESLTIQIEAHELPAREPGSTNGLRKGKTRAKATKDAAGKRRSVDKSTTRGSRSPKRRVKAKNPQGQ